MRQDTPRCFASGVQQLEELPQSPLPGGKSKGIPQGLDADQHVQDDGGGAEDPDGMVGTRGDQQHVPFAHQDMAAIYLLAAGASGNHLDLQELVVVGILGQKVEK